MRPVFQDTIPSPENGFQGNCFAACERHNQTGRWI